MPLLFRLSCKSKIYPLLHIFCKAVQWARFESLLTDPGPQALCFTPLLYRFHFTLISQIGPYLNARFFINFSEACVLQTVIFVIYLSDPQTSNKTKVAAVKY